MINIQHLETDVTTVCQLSCVACNHFVPLYRAKGPKHTSPVTIERDLNALSKFLHANAWGALGGEPLLNKELNTILRIARESGIASSIEVWTNGLRLRPEEEHQWDAKGFWTNDAWDTLVLSVYPGYHTAETIARIQYKCGVWEKRLVITPDPTINFRTLLEPTPDTDPKRTWAKYEGCFFRRFSRVVNNGYFFTCCCAPHHGPLILDRPFGEDGIALDGLTEDALKSYLLRKEPLAACATCAGRDTAQPVTWRERRKPAEWLAASGGVE